MGSERYDETVREQKRAQREQQIKKQKIALFVALIIIIAIVGVLLYTMFGKKKEEKQAFADTKWKQSVGEVYQKFQEANHLDIKAAEFTDWLLETYPEESQGEMMKKIDSGTLEELDFYKSYGKTLHVLSDEYKGYLKDSNTAKSQGIYLKEGAVNGQVEIVLGGDLELIEEEAFLQDYDNDEFQTNVPEEFIQQMQKADLLYFNQEYSLSDAGTALEGKTDVFHANAGRIEIMKQLGIDLVSLSNDHAADYGQEGLQETMNLLADAGIAYVGAGENLSQAQSPVYFIVNGLKIGFTAISGMEDEFQTEAGEESVGIHQLHDLKEYTAQIEEAAQNCDYLISYIHNGENENAQPSEEQQEQSEAMIKAGADFVIGGHGNRLQGIEYVEGSPILYSLGDFLPEGDSKYEALVKLHITASGLEEMSLMPALQSESGMKYLDNSDDQKKMYEAYEELCTNAQIDEKGVITEKKS